MSWGFSSQLSQCFCHKLLLFSLVDLFKVCCSVCQRFFFFDIPSYCTSYPQCLCNGSDRYPLSSELLFSQRLLAGLHVGLSFLTQMQSSVNLNTSGQQETPVSHMFQYFCSPKNWVVWYKSDMFFNKSVIQYYIPQRVPGNPLRYPRRKLQVFQFQMCRETPNIRSVSLIVLELLEPFEMFINLMHFSKLAIPSNIRPLIWHVTSKRLETSYRSS